MRPPNGSPAWPLALCALLAAPALLAPPAQAHGGAFETSLWLDGAPLLVALEGAPVPVAMAPLVLHVTLPSLPPDEDVRVQWISPDGEALDVETLRPLDAATREGSVLFPGPGPWRLRVLAGDGEATLEVRVHPAGRAFVVAADAMAARGVLLAGAEETLALRVTDAHGAPLPAAADARAHAELWDAAGTRLLEEATLPLREAAPGELVAQARWDQPGLLRVRVASAAWGLAPEDRPPVEILVVPPEEAHVYGLDAREDPHGGAQGDAREAPAAGWAWALAALGLGALALRRRA